ncbi:hypothetical protein BKA64DRAFT_102121 [Cadophora sp. MPI-SDFR-AT-0126]|nr:hypothetical protein BKA64DRAFT_102121 [Leotiomycetes sp. MPI-SDFR-AT-0126]
MSSALVLCSSFLIFLSVANYNTNLRAASHPQNAVPAVKGEETLEIPESSAAHIDTRGATPFHRHHTHSLSHNQTFQFTSQLSLFSVQHHSPRSLPVIHPSIHPDSGTQPFGTHIFPAGTTKSPSDTFARFDNPASLRRFTAATVAF